MNRADRKRWAAARTLADLGELTAQWLEGTIASQSAYAPGCGPAEETSSLVPVLAAACRAGFVMNGWQPGIAADGPWSQRAAVSGFADDETARRLLAVADSYRLAVVTGHAARWRNQRAPAVPVTLCAGRPVTSFGTILSRRHLSDSWVGYGVCHRAAVAALHGAWQITLADTEYGPNDQLWPALQRFASGARPPAVPWPPRPRFLTRTAMGTAAGIAGSYFAAREDPAAGGQS